ncbi:MAG: hemolysin family protein [Candidatus Omnitrophota bacterium]
MIMLYTILIIAAIGIQAFFTASEMAFTSLSRVKLRAFAESGDKNALRLQNFLKKEGIYLGTTLVGTNIAVVISSVLATRVFAEYAGTTLAPFVATALMVPVTLIFAEIVPKIIARQFSFPLALRTTGLIGSFFRLFYPVIMTVNFAAKILLAPFGKRKAYNEVTLTKSDLKRILLLGHETGEVEADEVELIHKVLDFGSKKVKDIMVPLYRIASIDFKDTIDNLKKLVSLTGFSRIPVYKKNKNSIIGIVTIYDVLFELSITKNKIKDFIRETVYVNCNDGLDIALTRLRHRKQPMGIVADEKGKIQGIITIEDILEEIVGEIEDTG